VQSSECGYYDCSECGYYGGEYSCPQPPQTGAEKAYIWGDAIYEALAGIGITFTCVCKAYAERMPSLKLPATGAEMRVVRKAEMGKKAAETSGGGGFIEAGQIVTVLEAKK
jgi:hypothetical protein